MRIALGAEALAPQLTGIGRYTWELCRRLPLVSGVQDVRLYRENAWFASGQQFLTGSGNRRKLLPQRFHAWASRREFKRRMFHGPNFFSPPEAENAVITVHDLSVFRFPETHPIERIRHFEREFERSLNGARHIITDTNFIKNELVEMFGVNPDRISPVALGVSEEFFEQVQPNDETVLQSYDLRNRKFCLCVSTIEPRKGLGHAVQAFMRYREQNKVDDILVIVGASGWNNSDLHRAFSDASAAGAVKFLGFVEDSKLRALYRHCSLFFYPSLYEGFGLPVLEAMASNAPVVISDNSCLLEVSGDVSLSVNVEDHDAFAETIARGMQDQRWRVSAVEKGLALSRQLNWQKCAEATVDVYRKILP